MTSFQRNVNFNDFLRNSQAQLESSPLFQKGQVKKERDGLPWFLATTGDLLGERRSGSASRSVEDERFNAAVHRRSMPAGSHAQGGPVPGRVGAEQHRRTAVDPRKGFTGGVHATWREHANMMAKRGEAFEEGPLHERIAATVSERQLRASLGSLCSDDADVRPRPASRATSWGSFPWLGSAEGSSRPAMGSQLSLSRTAGSASSPQLGMEEKVAGHHRVGSGMHGFDTISMQQQRQNMPCFYKQDLRRVEKRSKYD